MCLHICSQYLPILCGVGHSSNELHSFGVVVNLSVQSEILLDKVVWRHELLAILVHHAGVLGRRQTAKAFANLTILRGRSGLVTHDPCVSLMRCVHFVISAKVVHLKRIFGMETHNGSDFSSIQHELFI